MDYTNIVNEIIKLRDKLAPPTAYKPKTTYDIILYGLCEFDILDDLTKIQIYKISIWPKMIAYHINQIIK